MNKVNKDKYLNPRWSTLKMVESTIKNFKDRFKDRELTTYQLWRELPRAMQYQRLQAILKILIEEGKVKLERRSEGERQKEVIIWSGDSLFAKKKPADETTLTQ